MKIIVVGMGQSGMGLADLLAKEKHDVIVVDSDKEKIDYVTNHYSVSGVCGSGVSKAVLKSAGAETADVVLAMTELDEVNLMICKIAKSCGTRYGAARLYQPALTMEEKELAQEFQVDYLLNPKMETAKVMVNQIGLSGRVKADAFFDGLGCMIRVTVEKNMLPKEQMPLLEIKSFFGVEMLVATIKRDGELMIPDGKSYVTAGDVLDIVASNESIHEIVKKLGLVKKATKNVFMVGGGDISFYLAEALLKDKKKVTIVEKDKKRCMELLEKLPEAKVCLANGLKEEVLLEEGMKDADACVSVTGSDENNLVISLFAWSQGIESILTKVESTDYENLLTKVNIDITVSPSIITINSMFGFVRNVAVYNASGNDIQSVQQFAEGKAEAVEFNAYNHNKNLNIAIKKPEFRLKKGLLIGMIIRDNVCIIPGGDSVLKAGDKVVVFTKRQKEIGLNTLDDIFE